MKILFIYPNAQGYGRIPLGLSVLMTLLIEKGHDVELFDTTFILTAANNDNLIREKAGVAIPVDTSDIYDPHSAEEVDDLLRVKIKLFKPELVGISIVEDNYQYADRLLSVIRQIGPKITIIAGGTTPTVAPEIIIKNPNIDYLIKGEAEEALVEFCEKMENKLPVEDTPNLWYLNNGQVKSNPIRSFVNMGELPPQNLDLWDERHYTKVYDGRIYQTGYFELSRGCTQKCTYCVNETYQRVLEDSGKYTRKKSIKSMINEIKLLKNKFNYELIFFCDDNFMYMNPTRITEFVSAWKKEINLPFWINTTIESLNPKRLAFLKEANCIGIGIGVESGSEWLRQNILGRRLTNKAILKGFKMIHDAGIRTTGNTMLGFPGEYEGDIYETFKYIKKLNPDSTDVSFVAPYIGTPIHEICKNLGYLETWDKPGFEGMVKDISYRQYSTINSPLVSHEKIIKLYYSFMDHVVGKKPIPAKYKNKFPGADDTAPPRGNLSIEVANAMYKTGTSGVRSIEKKIAA